MTFDYTPTTWTDGQALTAANSANRWETGLDNMSNDLSTTADQVGSLVTFVTNAATGYRQGQTADAGPPAVGLPLFFNQQTNELWIPGGSSWLKVALTAVIGSGGGNAPTAFTAVVNADNTDTQTWTLPTPPAGYTITGVTVREKFLSPNGIAGMPLPGTATSHTSPAHSAAATREYYVTCTFTPMSSGAAIESAESNHVMNYLPYGSSPAGGGGGTGGGSGGSSDIQGPDSTRAAYVQGWGAVIAGDEFDYTGDHNTLTTKGWNVYDGPGHDGNGVRAPSAFTVDGGFLRCHGDAAMNTGGMDYEPDSNGGFSAQYYRVECRMRINRSGASNGGAEYHPVLILWPDGSVTWPRGGEYDYAETDSNASTVEANMHHPSTDESDVTSFSFADHGQPGGWSFGDWHNYALEWTSTALKGYIDGVLWFTDTNAVNSHSMHQTIQLDSFHTTGTTMQPVDMDVAWVRMYSPTGTGATTPTTVTPASILGLGTKNFFSVDIGIAGGADVVHTASELAAGFVQDPYFTVNATNDAVAMQTFANGGTTPNSPHPRTELREVLSDLTTKAAWTAASGKTHRMMGTSTITHVPADAEASGVPKPQVCFAQIHDQAGDVVRLQVEDSASTPAESGGTHSASSLHMVAHTHSPNATSSSTPEVKTRMASSYTVGSPINWMIDVHDTICDLWIGGTISGSLASGYTYSGGTKVYTFTISGTGFYFKTGDYQQFSTAVTNSSGNPDGGYAASSYARTELKKLYVTHSPAL